MHNAGWRCRPRCRYLGLEPLGVDHKVLQCVYRRSSFEATCDRRGMSVVLSRRSSVPGALRVVWCEQQVFHGMGRRAARDAYLITSVNKNPWNYGFFCPFPICYGSVCVAVTCGLLKLRSALLAPPSPFTARGPPTNWGELVQVHDDRETIQASPDELPAIDIRSL